MRILRHTPLNPQGPDRILGERRAHQRWTLDLPLRYRSPMRGKPMLEGTGRVKDMNSAGVLFDAGAIIPVGRNIELVLDWPARSPSGDPLEVAVWGRTVRSNKAGTAVRITRLKMRKTARLDAAALSAASGFPFV